MLICGKQTSKDYLELPATNFGPWSGEKLFIPPLTRSERQQAQEDPIKKRAQEFLPEIPQAKYWEYLETSVTKIQEAMEQIIKQQKEHSQMLTYMFKEQEEQGRDLRELKRQKSSVIPSLPRIRGTPIPPE